MLLGTRHSLPLSAIAAGLVLAACEVDEHPVQAPPASQAQQPTDLPPTLAWVAPAEAVTLTEPTLLQVAAADDHGLAHVVYRLNGLQVARVDAPPFAWVLDPADRDGTWLVQAVAYDSAGQASPEVRRVVRLQTQGLPCGAPPRIVWQDLPAVDLALCGKAWMPLVVQGGCGDVQVGLLAGSVPVTNPPKGQQGVVWNAEEAAPGRHVLHAVAVDQAGQVGHALVEATAANLPCAVSPTLSIVEPVGGLVGKHLPLRIQVQTPPHAPPVARVVAAVGPKSFEFQQPPYEATIPTQGMALPGLLTVQATDATGQVLVANRKLVMAKQPPTLQWLQPGSGTELVRGQPLPIAVTVTDAAEMAEVRVALTRPGSTWPIATWQKPPFQVDWTPPADLPAGEYELLAEAVDRLGLATVVTRPAKVLGWPAASLTGLQDLMPIGSHAIACSGQGPNAPVLAQLVIDGSPVAKLPGPLSSQPKVQHTWHVATPGQHTLACKVQVPGKPPVQVARTVTVVPMTLPALVCKSPTFCEALPEAGVMALTGKPFLRLMWNPGPGLAVATWALQVDGQLVGEKLGPLTEVPLDLAQMGDGLHTLTFVLQEAAGNQAVFHRKVQTLAVDADGDGHGALPGGKDCDDNDASIHPGATDLAGDGIDSDCASGDAAGCDDGDPCTVDGFFSTDCQYLPLPNGVPCSDGDECSVDDFCKGGKCQGGPKALDCDDGLACSADGCSPKAGCLHLALTTLCDDGDACTQNDACAGLACKGTASACDDGDVCTVDACDPAIGCTDKPAPDGTDCGSACAVGTCSKGTCQFAQVQTAIATYTGSGVSLGALAATGSGFVLAGSKQGGGWLVGVDPIGKKVWELLVPKAEVTQIVKVAVQGDKVLALGKSPTADWGGKPTAVWAATTGSLLGVEPLKDCTFVEEVVALSDGGFLAVGGWNPGYETTACTLRWDAAGKLVKVQKFAENIGSFQHVVAAPDGGVFVHTSSTVARLSAQGSMVWTYPWSAAALTVLNGGDLVLVGYGSWLRLSPDGAKVQSAALGYYSTLIGLAPGPANGWYLLQLDYKLGVRRYDGSGQLVAETSDAIATTTTAAVLATPTGPAWVAKVDYDGTAAVFHRTGPWLITSCTKAGACATVAPTACDDGNACTIDSCDPVSGCTHKAAGGPCDDGDGCSVDDKCLAGACAGQPKPCADDQPCTQDGCQAGECTHLALAEGSPCTSKCATGTCQAGTCLTTGPGPWSLPLGKNRAVLGLAALPEDGAAFAGMVAGVGGIPKAAWLGRVDAWGKVLWQKEVGGAGAILRRVRAVKDGHWWTAGQAVTPGQGLLGGWVARWQADGLQIGETFLPDPAGAQLRDVAVDATGACVAGSVASFDEERGWVVRLSAAATPTWQHVDTATGPTDLQGVTTTPDGGCIAVGKYGKGGLAIGLAPSGQLLWRKEIPAIQGVLRSVHWTPFGAVAAGMHVPYVDPGWLLRLDLATGQVLKEDSVWETGDLTDLIPAPGGGWVAVGFLNSVWRMVGRDEAFQPLWTDGPQWAANPPGDRAQAVAVTSSGWLVALAQGTSDGMSGQATLVRRPAWPESKCDLQKPGPCDLLGLTACDDGNPCTADWCKTSGGCVHQAVAAPCDDGDPCTSGDTCGAASCKGEVVEGCLP